MVFLADTGTSGHQNHIRIGLHRCKDRIRIVGHDAWTDRQPAISAHQCSQHRPICIRDVITRRPAASRKQLVTSYQDAHYGTSYHDCFCTADRGKHANVLRPNLSTCRKDDAASRHVLALSPDVLAGRNLSEHKNVRTSLSTCSAGRTASAPIGMGAPVITLTACPEETTPRNLLPGSTVPTTLSRSLLYDDAPNVSAEWTANPSIIERSKPGTSTSLTTSSARARPTSWPRSTHSADRGRECD